MKLENVKVKQCETAETGKRKKIPMPSVRIKIVAAFVCLQLHINPHKIHIKSRIKYQMLYICRTYKNSRRPSFVNVPLRSE